jgi:hypothetical protein
MDELDRGRQAAPQEHLVAIAARNNAEWCETICGLHRIAGEFEEDAWASGARTPEHYPDAVTLRRGVDAARLLSRVDASSGCSIKDSFADLDLKPWRFGRLFEASWIHRPALPAVGGAAAADLEPIRDQATLTAWERTWSGGATGRPVFLPDLLDRDDVVVLAARRADSIVAGAILSLGAGAVGLSNLFAVGTDLASAFVGASSVAARLFPRIPIVGYESGPLLDAAEQAGFVRVGRLVVWLRS